MDNCWALFLSGGELSSVRSCPRTVNLLFHACVNTFRPHKNHAYAYLKYALKYASLIVFMPFFFACQLVPPENEDF